MKTVLISSPCHDMVYTYYSNSVVKSIMNLYENKVNCAINYESFFATYIHEGRNAIAKHAKNVGASHIIWVDTDMLFTPDAFRILIEHDLDFVGVNYSSRKPPFKYTAGMWNDDKKTYDTIPTLDTSTGLQKVDGIGFGLCMMATHLFDLLEKPWFDYEYMPNDDMHMGEDYLICRKLREKGVEIYVDHDLSKQVKHVGSFPYHHNMPLNNF
jgi:hypothetical protein